MAEKVSVAAVVLAGGASSRMGRPKALAPFLGRPLGLCVLDRLRPQAARVYLNARQADPALAALGAPLALDAVEWRGAGPLAGVAAALMRARRDGYEAVVTAPCDAPFTPLDLVSRLSAAAAPTAVAVSETGVEPMFALWPVEALEAVQAALRLGATSPGALLRALGAAQARFPAAPGRDNFANLNTPQEFAAAEAAAKSFQGEIS